MIAVKKREHRMKFRSGLKVASFSILIVLMLAVFLIAAFLYADPSKLKTQIESLAQQRGIELQLSGDLGWAIYPNIKLNVRGASAAYTNPSMMVEVNADYLSFSMKPWPALRGEFDFVGVEVSGAEIDALIMETDADQANLGQRLADIGDLLPRASVTNLELSDIQLNLENADGENQRTQIKRLSAQNISSDGTPFTVKANFQSSSMPAGFSSIHLDGYVMIDLFREIYGIDAGQLSVGGEESELLDLSGYGRIDMDLNRNQWSLNLNLAHHGIAGISAEYLGTISPMAGEGRIEVNTSDMSQVLSQLAGGQQPATAPLVKILAVDADLAVGENMIQVENLRLRADRNSGRGSLNYGINGLSRIDADLSFQALDLSAYFPQKPNTGAGKRSPATGMFSSEALSALGEIKDLEVNISAETLSVWEQNLKDVHLSAEISNGVVAAKIDQAEISGGKLSMAMAADFLTDDDVQLVQINLEGFDLTQLKQEPKSAIRLQGMVNLKYDGQLRDLSQLQPLQGLSGTGELAVMDLVVSSMNIEQAICESAEIAGATSSTNVDWPTGTVLGNIDTPYIVDRGVVYAEEFAFNYGNMGVTGEGNLNLLDRDYKVGLSVKVDAEKTSADGCNLNKYARGVPLPLQCAGSLGANSEMSCGVDASIAERLVLQQVGGKLIESVLGRLGDGTSLENTGENKKANDGVKRDELRAILEGMLRDIDN